MVTDADLLAQWRQGDARAGRALFARHFDGLYRFFANKVSRGIDDLVQETFLACVEGEGRLRDAASFRAYLYGIARRRLFRKWRNENQGAGAIDFGLTSVAELVPTPSAIVASAEEQQLLLEGLRRIPAELQLALELFYWEDLSAPELAVVLEIPEGTVRSRLRRGRELLRQQVQRLSNAALDEVDEAARGLRATVSPPVE